MFMPNWLYMISMLPEVNRQKLREIFSLWWALHWVDGYFTHHLLLNS